MAPQGGVGAGQPRLPTLGEVNILHELTHVGFPGHAFCGWLGLVLCGVPGHGVGLGVVHGHRLVLWVGVILGLGLVFGGLVLERPPVLGLGLGLGLVLKLGLDKLGLEHLRGLHGGVGLYGGVSLYCSFCLHGGGGLQGGVLASLITLEFHREVVTRDVLQHLFTVKFKQSAHVHSQNLPQ